MSASVRKGLWHVVLVMSVVGFATPAAADWLVTPYVGFTVGGAANVGGVGDFEQNFKNKVTFGGTLNWMSAGIFGVELDVSTTPKFFDMEGDEDVEFSDSDTLTAMANLVIGMPHAPEGRRFRPYISGGAGLLRTNLSVAGLFEDRASEEFGINVGAGGHVFVSDNVGVRGDVRYFRAVNEGDGGDNPSILDLEIQNLDYWRATLGLTFRFGG